MYARVDRPNENKSRAVANSVAQKKKSLLQRNEFVDNRPEAIKQRNLQKMVSIDDDARQATGRDVIGGKPKSIGVMANRDRSNAPEKTNIAPVHQLYANKIVLHSARNHYADGWGAQYGVTNDNNLKASVPNSVTGSGTVGLGWNDAPEVEQTRRIQKYCSICYRDATETNTTAIFHCGPSGRRRYYG